jgi:hypothetical protein
MIPLGTGHMARGIGRRQFISAIGGASLAWPLPALAQQPALPLVAFLRTGSADANARYVAAFGKGLNETGYVDGQNVTARRFPYQLIAASDLG